jgi:membrane-bound ClpP family serine protease
MNVRLIVAILTSLLDDFIIVAIILWGLPEIGIHVPLIGIILVLVVLTVYSVVTFRFGSRILRKKPLAGLTTMLELKGKALSQLNPVGTVKIQSELWAAKSEDGKIEAGCPVVVVGQDGLSLIVRSVEPGPARKD